MTFTQLRPAPTPRRSEGRASAIASRLLLPLYGRLSSETIRRPLRRLILALEGGGNKSLTIRVLLSRFYGLELGLHSVAPCLSKPQVLHSGTSIGRYTTLADTVRTFTRNHPLNTKSSHGVFYNPDLGWTKVRLVRPGRLEIGHGVTIGHHAIILTPTRRVGDGAFIKPGAVVYSDVPPYAIVQGNPAQVVGFRYSPDVVQRIVNSRWWDNAPSALEPEQCALDASESPFVAQMRNDAV